MDQILKPEEKELIRLVDYFKKRAQTLPANKLPVDYEQVMDTCNKLIEQMNFHAQNREIVLNERQKLEGMIKDNAKCPKCSSADMIKPIGFETNSQGWKSNKYKCRRCNIAFVWNTPNNPWDMVPYVEKFIIDTVAKISEQDINDPEIQPSIIALDQMRTNLGKLKPVVEASDNHLKELNARETEMADMVKKVKKHLMIEKIKLEE